MAGSLNGWPYGGARSVPRPAGMGGISPSFRLGGLTKRVGRMVAECSALRRRPVAPLRLSTRSQLKSPTSFDLYAGGWSLFRPPPPHGRRRRKKQLVVAVVCCTTWVTPLMETEAPDNWRGMDFDAPRAHWLNRKNFCASRMELVTVFCPLTTTGTGETVLQTAGETRFVVDCNANPKALVGHLKTTFVPERMIVSCGDGGSVRLKTAP